MKLTVPDGVFDGTVTSATVTIQSPEAGMVNTVTQLKLVVVSSFAGTVTVTLTVVGDVIAPRGEAVTITE
jgi:hypothetical protein